MGENLKQETALCNARLVQAKQGKGGLGVFAENGSRLVQWSSREIASSQYRTKLYRFLADTIPVVGACLWTWVRFGAAPGQFEIIEPDARSKHKAAIDRLNRLSERIGINRFGAQVGMSTFLIDLFTFLYRDGIVGGFLVTDKNRAGVESFQLIDPAQLVLDSSTGKDLLLLATDSQTVRLDRPDFRHISLGGGIAEPLGRSIFRSIPFVAYIEQQLVDDMRRSSHNSGYHRLHVQITPPERLGGESEKAYIERINRYFDDTVSMIKSCDVDENPVTWNNVTIQTIGPNAAKSVTNSWFFNHRAMIEEVCAGTNLAPFLLGYSYGATTTWSSFKFDMVMRQVQSVQTEVAQLLEWIGNVELALAGFDLKCRYKFDNTFAHQANEQASVQSVRIDSILKLYSAGLINVDTARIKAAELL